MKKLTFLSLSFLFFLPSTKAQTVSDIDGNVYNVITIGSQTWMKENLKTTRFNNGIAIPTTTAAVNNTTASAYQWLYNDDPVRLNVYGRLYSWFVVDNTNNVCPIGWHVPSQDEWTILSNFLGGANVAGNKMKETGIVHWSATDNAVDNSSAFTGLPGGFRGNPSGYNFKTTAAAFWSSTPWGSDAFPRAYNYRLHKDNGSLEEGVAVGNCGMSVRCIQDLETGLKDPKTISGTAIIVFPNPASSNVTVNVEEYKGLKISIYTITGAIVCTQELQDKTTVVDLDALPKGMYVLRIFGEHISLQQKLVKE